MVSKATGYPGVWGWAGPGAGWKESGRGRSWQQPISSRGHDVISPTPTHPQVWVAPQRLLEVPRTVAAVLGEEKGGAVAVEEKEGTPGGCLGNLGVTLADSASLKDNPIKMSSVLFLSV